MSPSADSRILVSWLGPEFSPHPALSRREREFFLLTRGRSLREVTERRVLAPVAACEVSRGNRGRRRTPRERERSERSGGRPILHPDEPVAGGEVRSRASESDGMVNFPRFS